MATLGKISSLLQELYDGGRVKTTSKTLDVRDMQEYVKLGYANVMRNMWLSLNKGVTNDEYYFFTGLLQPKIFEVKEGKQFSTIDIKGVSFIRLPQNTHFFELLPYEGECDDMGDVIAQVTPGEAKFYRNGEYATFRFFEPFGDVLKIYNLSDCVKKVSLTALYDDNDVEVPSDIAFDVIKSVLKDLFDVKTFDRVKIDDNSNALIHELKSRLGIVAAP